MPIIEIIAGFSNSARKTLLAKLENLQIQNVICVLQLAHYSPDKSAANIAIFSRQIEHIKKMDGDRKNIAKGTTDPRVEFILPK